MPNEARFIHMTIVEAMLETDHVSIGTGKNATRRIDRSALGGADNFVRCRSADRRLRYIERCRYSILPQTCVNILETVEVVVEIGIRSGIRLSLMPEQMREDQSKFPSA